MKNVVSENNAEDVVREHAQQAMSLIFLGERDRGWPCMQWAIIIFMVLITSVRAHGECKHHILKFFCGNDAEVVLEYLEDGATLLRDDAQWSGVALG